MLRAQNRRAQRCQLVALYREVRLPQPLREIVVGHGGGIELLGQYLAGAWVEGHALAQQGPQMVDDFTVAGVRRLHTEQQAAHALDLTEGTEHRVAELQLDP
ncbi:hypothetical protein D3C76_1159890 [compost metagenome]